MRNILEDISDICVGVVVVSALSTVFTQERLFTDSSSFRYTRRRSGGGCIVSERK